MPKHDKRKDRRTIRKPAVTTAEMESVSQDMVTCCSAREPTHPLCPKSYELWL